MKTVSWEGLRAWLLHLGYTGSVVLDCAQGHPKRAKLTTELAIDKPDPVRHTDADPPSGASAKP